MILVEGPDLISAQAVSEVGIVPVAGKRAGGRKVHAVQAVGPGPDPQHAA